MSRDLPACAVVNECFAPQDCLMQRLTFFGFRIEIVPPVHGKVGNLLPAVLCWSVVKPLLCRALVHGPVDVLATRHFHEMSCNLPFEFAHDSRLLFSPVYALLRRKPIGVPAAQL